MDYFLFYKNFTRDGTLFPSDVKLYVKTHKSGYTGSDHTL